MFIALTVVPLRRFCRSLMVLGFFAGGVVDGAFAQAENHWFNRFGDQAFLLSGAVIGGASDLGAVFYNPGRLAQLEEAGFFQATNGFELASVTVEDGRGPGDDVVATDFRGAPSFVAGAFTLPGLSGHSFAYSFLTRRHRRTELHFSPTATGDVRPGTGSFVDRVDVNSRLREDWYGLSWATVLSTDVRLGISVFGTYSTRDHFAAYDLRASPVTGTVLRQRIRRYAWAGWGLLFKVGLAVTRGPLDLGLVVTLPQVGLGATGSVRFEDILVSIDTTSTGGTDVGYTASRQEDLPAALKTPAAVGVGAAWQAGRATLYVSTEWYAGIGQYTNVVSRPIYDSGGSSVGPYRVVSELTSVLHVGGGLRWGFGNDLAAFASVAWDPAPDASPPAPPLEGELSRTGFLLGDVVHVGLGAFVRTRWFEATTGITYSRAGELSARAFPLSAADLQMPRDESVHVTGNTLRLQIGLLIFVGTERSGA